MPNYNFETNNHKKEKIIILVIIFISFILIAVLGYLAYLNINNRPLIEYPSYSLSSTVWTSNDIVITITNDIDKISGYSFDGGVSFQESNSYLVTDNSTVMVMVKDINGRTSNSIPVVVNTIDKEPPVINFINNSIVRFGQNFSPRNGVQVYDDGSGLNWNYTSVPDKIDTNTVGEYIIKYTATDKVGNYIEKERKVIVTDKTGTIYYRYRDAIVESYECEQYSCGCISSDALDGTCQADYSLVEQNKCCKTCYKMCKRTTWGEWSNWSSTKVSPSATREVETKIE